MRLLLVELSRLRARRAVVLTLLGAAVLVAVFAWSGIRETRAPTPAELEAAAQTARSEEALILEERDRCRADPEQVLGPGAGLADCDFPLPQAEWYLARQQLDLAMVNDGRGTAIHFLILGVAVVVGATFAGGDWASGSLSNQLLFRPRRGGVWLAKAAAVTLGTTAAAALLVGGFWLAMYAAASARGVAVPPEVTTDILTTAGRGLALAAAATLGAFSLTMLFRHTVATLAVLFVYAVAGESLTASLPMERAGRWSLSNNVLAWLGNGTEVYDDRLARSCSQDTLGTGSCDTFYLLPLTHAAWYLGALLAVAVFASVVLFRRRDVP